jgi:signal transduction histidine kinase
MTAGDDIASSTGGRPITTEHQDAGPYAAAAELRASRKRLVLSADADRRTLERALHDGVQQYLVALGVGVQLVEAMLESDAAGAKGVLQELRRDVQRAIDEAARLAERISAPPPGPGGLAAALRSAAAAAGVPASVEVSAGSSYPPEAVQTIHSCWLEALAHSDGALPASVTVREEPGAIAFELACGGCAFDGLRDRVSALGGRVSVEQSPGRTHVSGFLPLPPGG